MAQGIIYYSPELSLYRLKQGNNYTDFPVDNTEIARGVYSFTPTNTKPKGARNTVSADFLMPHELYGVDFVTVPTIKRGLMAESLKTQLRSLYKNYDSLIFFTDEVVSGKTTTYRVVFVNKNILREIKDSFDAAGVTVNRFIPYGSALYEGCTKLESSLRKAPALVLNIRANDSYITISGKDIFTGGIKIPFGIKALSKQKVMQERQLYQNDASELLVINAKERAKSTKLTMAINLDEDIEDALPDEDAVVEKAPELPDITKMGREDEDIESDFEEENEDNSNVKTFRRKAVRALPKFMRRDEPQTPDGYIAENFRLFEKRLLMLVRELSLSDCAQKTENIYVVLPQEYKSVINAMKKENPEYKWVCIEQPITIDPAIRGAEIMPDNGKVPTFTI